MYEGFYIPVYVFVRLYITLYLFNFVSVFVGVQTSHSPWRSGGWERHAGPGPPRTDGQTGGRQPGQGQSLLQQHLVVLIIYLQNKSQAGIVWTLQDVGYLVLGYQGVVIDRSLYKVFYYILWNH